MLVRFIKHLLWTITEHSEPTVSAAHGQQRPITIEAQRLRRTDNHICAQPRLTKWEKESHYWGGQHFTTSNNISDTLSNCNDEERTTTARVS